MTRFLGLALACALLLVRPAAADQIFIDFESYPAGPIANGYGGWQIANPSYDQQVQSAGAINGAQGWNITNQFATGSFGDQPFTPALAGTSGESTTGAASNYFGASMLFRPLAGGVAGEGTTISLDRGDGARGNWMRIESAGDGTWNLQVFDYDGTDFVFSQIATGLLEESVHELAFDMTFVDGPQNDIWNVYLDGALLYTGVGWEDYFLDWQPLNLPPLAYDRLLFRQGGAASPGAVGIVFDDISYTNVAAAVPEPASLAVWSILGAAGLACTARRRRRSQR